MKLKFLLILCILTFSCNTNNKTQETSTNEIISDYAVLVVTKIQNQKEGYTATLKNDNGDFYTCVISITNLKNEYKTLKVENKVQIIGDYGNGNPTPIIAKRIIVIKE